jgi:hypothetical protein
MSFVPSHSHPRPTHPYPAATLPQPSKLYNAHDKTVRQIVRMGFATRFSPLSPTYPRPCPARHSYRRSPQQPTQFTFFVVLGLHPFYPLYYFSSIRSEASRSFNLLTIIYYASFDISSYKLYIVNSRKLGLKRIRFHANANIRIKFLTFIARP